jgi:hypothetical protein
VVHLQNARQVVGGWAEMRNRASVARFWAAAGRGGFCGVTRPPCCGILKVGSGE